MQLQRNTSNMPIFESGKEHELIENDQIGNLKGCNDILGAQ